ncbi:hypothetical protein LBMAG53_07870 [Planctomycetota bacterium]|nr:hypothetical protein LBMAG53_07870 [Planctomycetota bacterium]
MRSPIRQVAAALFIVAPALSAEPPCEDLSIRLDHGADGAEAVFSLARREGSWRLCRASVPAWRAATVKETFDWTERGRLPPRDAMSYPIDAQGLSWDGRHLAGEVAVAWRLDATRAERFPAGLASWVTFEGVYSPLDLFQVPGHQRQRKQRYQIDAQLTGRQRLQLVLRGLLPGGADVTAQIDLPARQGEIGRPTGWNAGVHALDASGWRLETTQGGWRLSGTARLIVNPDMIGPLTSTALKVTVQAESNSGLINGTWTTAVVDLGDLAQAGHPIDEPGIRGATLPLPTAGEGRLEGSLWPLIEGRYSSVGDLGTAASRLTGTVVIAAPLATPQVDGSGALADGERRWMAAKSAEWRQIGLTAEEVSQRCGFGQPVPGEPHAEAEHVALITTWTTAAANPPPAVTPIRDRPWRTTGVPVQPTAHAWKPLSGWRVLGPLPLAIGGTGVPAGRLPPLVPSQLARKIPGKDQPLQWSAQNLEADGRLLPPAFAAPRTSIDRKTKATVTVPAPPGQANSCWLAATDLQVPAGAYDLAIDGSAAIRVWIDGALVIEADAADETQEASGRGLGASAAVRMTLTAGNHQVLALVREDRSGSWLSLSTRLATQPAGAYSGHIVGIPARALPPAGSPGPLAWQAVNAKPPLAVDLAQGRGIRWKTAIPGLVAPAPGGGTEGGFSFPRNAGVPTVLADRIIVTGAGATLIALDALSGAESWRCPIGDDRQSILGVSVVDGNTAYVHSRSGLCAAVAADGKLRWQIPTGLGATDLRVHRNLVIVAGEPLQSNAKNSSVQTQLIAIDARTGAERWRSTRPGAVGPLLVTDIGANAVILSGGQAFAGEDGTALGQVPTLTPWDWSGVWSDGATLFQAHTFAQSAVALSRFSSGTTTAGAIATQVRWQTPVFAANRTAQGTIGVADAKRWYVVRRPEEFSKHDPCDAVMLDWCDLADGSHRGRLKPLWRGLDVPGQPVVAGDRLYIPAFNGNGVGKSDPEGIIVVDIGGDVPIRIGFIPVPNLRGTPVFIEDRMYVATADGIVCASATAAENDLAKAEGLLAALPPPPMARQIPLIAAEAGSPPMSIPVTSIAPGVCFHDHVASIAAWAASAEMPAGAPAPWAGGDLSTLPSEWRLAPMRERTRWSLWNRLDMWFMRWTGQEVDASALATGDNVAWLAAVIDLPEERVLTPTFDAEALSISVAGKTLRPESSCIFACGQHAVFAQVRPAVVRSRQPQPPTDVAAALSAGVLQPVAWPTRWQVRGPLPAAGAQPDPARLDDPFWTSAAIDRPATGNDGLVALDDLARGEQAVWLTASFDTKEPGQLILNATADWRMAWFIDGRPILDTRGSGNGGSHQQVGMHTAATALSVGTHRLAVQVMPGSKGCSLRSRAGLAPAAADRLAIAAAHPQTGGRAAPADQQWLAVTLRHGDLPSSEQAAWRAHVAPHTRYLAWILSTLPRSPQAQRAQAMLDSLKHGSSPTR